MIKQTFVLLNENLKSDAYSLCTEALVFDYFNDNFNC